MNIILFNSPESAIEQRQESAALRAGILLGDHIITAGNSYVDINFEHYFDPVSMEQKLDVIEGHFIKSREQVFTDEVVNAITLYKRLKKAKHPSRTDLIFLKSVERDIDNVINTIRKNVLESLSKTGMPQLKPLIQKKLLGAFPVCSENGELEDKEHFQASKLLQLDFNHATWDEKASGEAVVDESDIFCLPFEFFTPEFLKFKIAKATRRKAKDPDTIYMHHCFTFPALSKLSLTELLGVRSHVETSAIPFRKAAEEWICLSGKGNINDTVSYFRKTLIPACETLSQAFENNEILNFHHRLQNHELKYEVYLGEIPVYIFWDFFSHFKVIHANTIEKLNEIKGNGKFDKKRFPAVFLRGVTDKSRTEINTTDETHVTDTGLPLRKSLSID